MPEGTEGTVATQDGGGSTRIDTGAIPNTQTPQLSEAQQAFSKFFDGNETMKSFAGEADPFKALATKFEESSKAPAGIKLPTAESTPEELVAFKKAFGAFDKAEDYKYDPPTSDDEAIKKLLPAEAPYIKAFQEIALKGHMPEAAWKELMGAYNQMIVEDTKTSVELSSKAMGAIKENWSKTHGEEAPKVETVFQKYFANASAAEAQILSTLSPEQMIALGSVVYRQDKKLGAEDKIDTGAFGSDTMSEVEYMSERSKLLSEQRKLQSLGKAWSPEAEDVQAKLKSLGDRYKNSKALTK